MLRSLYSGVSGMRSNQTKMDVIGNNIANASTTAFKSGRVRFQDMLSQTQANAQSPSAQGRGGINPQQIGLGVSVAAIDTVFEGGALQPTGRDLDFAIEDEGFFIVSEDTQGIMKRYTRDGAFFKDYEGNLVNAEGLRILGYHPNDGQGTVTASTQNINNINTANNANLRPLNIPGEIDAGFAEYIRYAQLYTDEAGEVRSLTDFDPITGNLDRAIQSAEEVFTLANDVLTMAQVAQQYSRSSVFESAINDEGTNLEDAMTALQSAIDNENIGDVGDAVNDAMGAATKLLQAIKDADNEPKEKVTFETFSIDGSGLISAVYDDGQVYFLGRLGMAMFENPEGLEKLGGNTYSDSRNSGAPQIGNPNEDGFGVVRQGNLEMSNVDLANEFTEMIVTSRAYQANSRTITTSDEMLQELINLKR